MKIVDFFVFVLYKVFKFIMLLFPRTIAKFFLDGITFLIFVLNKEHKKYAKANIDLVYGESLSEEQKWKIVKESYRNLLYNLYEFVDNQSLDLEGFEKKIEVKNDHYLIQALQEKRKIILITAHYGNWEFGNTFIPLKYAPTTMVGRPMNNQYLNKELDTTRTKNNTQMLTKKDASRGLVKAIKQGRVLGLVIDQHTGSGIDVEFLAHRAKQADSSSRLAVKFDAVIIPLFFTMESFGKYTAEFLEPIEPSGYAGENQISELTQVQADIMSQQILKHPQQWFWHHKRFKCYYKEIYQ